MQTDMRGGKETHTEQSQYERRKRHGERRRRKTECPIARSPEVKTRGTYALAGALLIIMVITLEVKTRGTYALAGASLNGYRIYMS